MLGDDWRVSARDPGTGEYQAVADIDGWQPGEFGLTKAAADPVNRLPPLSFPNNSTNYYRMDGSLSLDKGVEFTGGAKSDSFYGSVNSDVINTGGGLSNLVVNAYTGDDKVRGGDSRDYIRTGNNIPSPAVSDNDLAYGGAQPGLRQWRYRGFPIGPKPGRAYRNPVRAKGTARKEHAPYDIPLLLVGKILQENHQNPTYGKRRT